MKQVIQIKNLKKEFYTKHKEPGFLGSLKSIIHPKTKTLTAVDNISFNVKERIRSDSPKK